MSARPWTPDRIVDELRGHGFVCDPQVATTLFLADELGRPVLLEGPPGVGKTELGRLWAELHGAELLRLQCYEGLDEARALYEWSYGKQMLYAQLLRDRVAELTEPASDLDAAVRRLDGHADVFFSEAFLLERPLLKALRHERPVVLLIDEVDRSDEPFEAFLLEVLGDYQVSIPELGTLRAGRRPRVLITSNDTRDLSDALRRRCLYAWLDYPSEEDELAILQLRFPDLDGELARRVVRFVAELRGRELRKPPGIAETIDWAATLVALQADRLDEGWIRRTLGALLKHREDVEAVLRGPGRARR